MRALLDTQAFLWSNADDSRLSSSARGFIERDENQILLSAVTSWEIAIKFALGRLPELPVPPEDYVPARMLESLLTPLPISMEHTFRVARLPNVHRDPFDRLLIAQAHVEGLPIITNDSRFAAYGVEVIW